VASNVVPAPFKALAGADTETAPARRRRLTQPVPSPASQAVWDSLWLVLHQQVAQDAMLLWRHTHRDDQLQLIAGAPDAVVTAYGRRVSADDQLRQLSSGRLDLLAHLRCTTDDGEMEQVLADLGLRSAISTVLCGDEQETILMTTGFRQRWQLSAQHAPAVSAFVEYLRACQEAALGSARTFASAGQPAWWDLRSQAPILWQQPYRPSVLRTVHDLMETLAEAARALRPRFDLSALRTQASASEPEVALALAHRAADLMDRLESIYLGPAQADASDRRAGFDELLSQALLLVRDAYHLCRGTWPGCLAVVRQRPTAIGEPAHGRHVSAGDLRHQLIDWVAHHIEVEHAAA
jgi:hypothetical protein